MREKFDHKEVFQTGAWKLKKYKLVSEGLLDTLL